jgi:hypothetical protein
MLNLLTSFVCDLLVDDELQMARLLRKKLLNKRDEQQNSKNTRSFLSNKTATTASINGYSLVNTIANTLTRYDIYNKPVFNNYVKILLFCIFFLI